MCIDAAFKIIIIIIEIEVQYFDGEDNVQYCVYWLYLLSKNLLMMGNFKISDLFCYDSIIFRIDLGWTALQTEDAFNQMTIIQHIEDYPTLLSRTRYH